ncbi:MAG: hypothetical protein ACI8W7_002685 [Gammaproteobacteria bacterium]|jgi:hypothetical protein
MDICQAFRRPLTLVLGITLLALSAASLAKNAQADSFPHNFRATFMLNTRNIDVGTTQWELAPLSPGRYSFSSRSEAIGIAKLFRDERINERSEWQFIDGRVRPLRYSYSRVGGKREREVSAEFDWEHAQLRHTLNAKRSTIPLVKGTLDKLVYVIALMNDLSRGVNDIGYQIADGGKAKTYQLKVVGEEQIDTVVGSLRATLVERTQSGKSRLTRIWCAQALNFLPVRIEHIEEDGTLQFTLTALQGLAVK